MGTLVQTAAAAIFVIAGLRFAGRPHPPALDVLASARLAGPLLPPPPQIQTTSAVSIPQLYLDPVSGLMWVLLAAVLIMVLLDAAGQWIDYSDDPASRAGHGPIWPLFSAALFSAALWPWMFTEHSGWLTVGTAITAATAVVAARRAAGRQRPAIGFFAGWATAIFSAALAGFAAARLALPVQALAALAILPGAAIGMVAQLWIGPSIGYSAALIWAFCGLAVSTMGSDPMIALAAILGISGMATVLVRAAS
nr:hypothetical protein [Paracoccus saliphilus]